MLNFEPIRHVFASFLGVDFNRGVKKLIFGLFGGSGAILCTPGGSYRGQNSKMLNFEPTRHMRHVFASFLGADFNRGSKN